MKIWPAWGALFLIACGGGGGDSRSDKPRDDDASQTDTSASLDTGAVDASTDVAADAATITSMSIGAAGGTLTTPDGVVVEIPAGALAADTTITVRRVEDAGGATVGPVFELGPDGTVFSAPVVLTLPYDEAALGATPAQALMLATETTAGWSSTGWALVATGPHTVTSFVSHFSRWAVIPSAPDGCAFDYGCFRTCCGVTEPNICCNGPVHGACECQSPRAFPDFVGCYAKCIGTPLVTNFANSKCMASCCTGQGGTTHRGTCLVDTGAKALAVMKCSGTCFASPDEATVCKTGKVTLEACSWDAKMSPDLGCTDSAGKRLGSVNSQLLYTAVRQVLGQNWGSVVDLTGGSYSSTSLTADVHCLGTTDTGTISATWTGTQFSGTFSVGSSSGSITISPTW